MVLFVIYAVLLRIGFWGYLRSFGANFLGPNLYLCYSNRFLHLCDDGDGDDLHYHEVNKYDNDSCAL